MARQEAYHAVDVEGYVTTIAPNKALKVIA